ncbi:TraB/GumN family protein [Sphingomonas sp.]
MIRKLLSASTALAAMFLPLSLQAGQTATPVTTASSEQAARPSPALWVVRDEDTTIYLLGTIHVMKPGVEWFEGSIREAFDQADEIALEMVMPDTATMQSLVTRLAAMPDGPPLSERLPENKRAPYAAALASLGLPAAAFDRYKPWFASTNLALLPMLKLGYDPAQGVDQRISEAARRSGKPVTGLETAEQQLGMLDGLPERVQIAMLTSTVDEMSQIGTTIDSMVTAWSVGDADRLADIMNEAMRETPEAGKVLLNDRNERWADWIVRRLERPGTVLMAVGAGHLAGSNSVQVKLAARQVAAMRHGAPTPDAEPQAAVPEPAE